MKKKSISLKKLVLTKEQILDLDQQAVSGGLNAPSGGCHSINWVCGSYATNCYSACQGPGCANTFTCSGTMDPGCSGSIIISVHCSD